MIPKIKSELKWLLVKDDFLVISLSVYLGFVLQKFLESLVSDVVYPILDAITPYSLNDLKFRVAGKEIMLNILVKRFIDLILAIALSYIILRVILKQLN